MKIISGIATLIPALLLCNCASIVSKSDYPVTITSPNPTNITVKNKATSNVVHTGTTPTTVTLSASEGYFRPAKYEIESKTSAQSLNASMDPWYAGNLIFGGLIGILLVDPATGAMWKLPKNANIN